MTVSPSSFPWVIGLFDRFGDLQVIPRPSCFSRISTNHPNTPSVATSVLHSGHLRLRQDARGWEGRAGTTLVMLKTAVVMLRRHPLTNAIPYAVDWLDNRRTRLIAEGQGCWGVVDEGVCVRSLKGFTSSLLSQEWFWLC